MAIITGMNIENVELIQKGIIDDTDAIKYEIDVHTKLFDDLIANPLMAGKFLLAADAVVQDVKNTHIKIQENIDDLVKIIKNSAIRKSEIEAIFTDKFREIAMANINVDDDFQNVN